MNGELENRVRLLETFKANMDGRMMAYAGVVLVINIVIAGLALLLVNKK